MCITESLYLLKSVLKPVVAPVYRKERTVQKIVVLECFSSSENDRRSDDSFVAEVMQAWVA